MGEVEKRRMGGVEKMRMGGAKIRALTNPEGIQT